MKLFYMSPISTGGGGAPKKPDDDEGEEKKGFGPNVDPEDPKAEDKPVGDDEKAPVEQEFDKEALVEEVKKSVIEAITPPEPDPVDVAAEAGNFEEAARLEREKRLALELAVGTKDACNELGCPELIPAFDSADLSTVDGRRAFVQSVLDFIQPKINAELEKRLATDTPLVKSPNIGDLTDDDIDGMTLNEYEEKRKAGIIN